MDESFKTFKTKLEYAVLKKDTIIFESLLNEKIENGMMDYYHKNRIYDNIEDVWTKLDRVLKYGFHRGYRETSESLNVKTKFTAPSYLKSIFKGNRNKIVVLAEKLNVRENPDIKSKVITQISYGLYEPFFDKNDNALTVVSDDKTEWIKIKLRDTKFGFIVSKFTSEYLYMTLVVSKIDNNWKITEFYNDTRNW